MMYANKFFWNTLAKFQEFWWVIEVHNSTTIWLTLVVPKYYHNFKFANTCINFNTKFLLAVDCLESELTNQNLNVQTWVFQKSATNGQKYDDYKLSLIWKNIIMLRVSATFPWAKYASLKQPVNGQI